ncbi:hypothetical protein SH1V18_43140 [Vallitalea longa]|uniref:YdbS-like PH domain-containing protein n=1 Tax=Vallitalea longa TaxID=2936439 RepID=A0A9W6DIE9_9FIRM|nr:PH domain-containing protein [Vallitalea longa]GKX31834.1 hypothetical protein SH1V18_43140 [Vallitalea longa]
MNYKRIDKKAVKAWIIARAIFLIIFGIMYFIGIYVLLMPTINDVSVKYVINIFTVLIMGYLMIYTFLFPFIEYKEWKYSISNDKIELIHGIFIRKKIIIPINRLQFLDVNQGPIHRKYKLSTIRLNTAGGLHEIPALTNEEAESISKNLAKVVKAGEDID